MTRRKSLRKLSTKGLALILALTLVNTNIAFAVEGTGGAAEATEYENTVSGFEADEEDISMGVSDTDEDIPGDDETGNMDSTDPESDNGEATGSETVPEEGKGEISDTDAEKGEDTESGDDGSEDTSGPEETMDESEEMPGEGTDISENESLSDGESGVSDGNTEEAVIQGEETTSTEGNVEADGETVSDGGTGEVQEDVPETIEETVPEDGLVVSKAGTLSPEFKAEKDIDGIRITVSAPEGVFPEGAELSVTKVSSEGELEEIEAAVEEERPEETNVAGNYQFDIKVMLEGEEIEPDTSFGNVRVSFVLENSAAKNGSINVYHVSKDEEGLKAENLETSVTMEPAEPEESEEIIATKMASMGKKNITEKSAGKGEIGEAVERTVISIETDSFSYYVVEFTYGKMEYILKGDSSVKLSEILDALGLAGEVTAISVSDPELFTAEKEGEDWIVTAVKAFTSEEWMDVTMDSFVYRIVVKDDTEITLYWGISNEGELKISSKRVPDNYNGGGSFNGAIKFLSNGPIEAIRPWSGKAIKRIVIGGDDDIVQPIYTTQWFQHCSEVTSIDMTHLDTSRVVDMDRMFYRCSSLKALDVSGLDTSNVTTISYMFNGCSSLTTLDVSGFDTSKVTSMSYMFTDCTNLTTLDVSGFDTSNVIDMSSMFNGCENLTALDVRDFDTSKVTDMHRVFYGCKNLTALDVGDFNTSKVTSMSYMFTDCTNLTTLDVSGFDTSNATDMRCMFSGCKNLTALDVSGFDTSNATDMGAMFGGCENLTTLDLSGFDTSNATSMSSMFNGCTNLTTLDVSGFDTSNATSMIEMFSDCTNLTTLDLSGFDTSKVTSMSYMFDGCTNLTTLDVSGFDTGKVKSMGGMFSYCENLAALDVSNFNTSNVTNMDRMFKLCRNLTTLDLSGFDTSNVSNIGLYEMFYGCSNLTTLDVSGFDTSKVTSMGYMFSGCTNLSTLDVSGFNTSNATDMGSMFSNCKSITKLDVSSFDTGKVTSMSYMFTDCTNLTTLDVSGFDTSNVTDMRCMFNGCENLTALDVSGFDTSNATDMSGMFRDCKNIKMLDLSGFDTSKVTYIYGMFFYCISLVTIYGGEKWNTDNLMYATNMFDSNDLLVGGKGTTYDSKHTDKEYARVDGGPDAPGYFTCRDPEEVEIYTGWRIDSQGYSYLQDGEPLKNGVYPLTFPMEGHVYEGKWLFDEAGYAVSGLHDDHYYYENKGGVYPYGMEVTAKGIEQKLKEGPSAFSVLSGYTFLDTFSDDLNWFMIKPSEGITILCDAIDKIGRLVYSTLQLLSGQNTYIDWTNQAKIQGFEQVYYSDVSTNKKILCSLLDEMFDDGSEFHIENKDVYKVYKYGAGLTTDALSEAFTDKLEKARKQFESDLSNNSSEKWPESYKKLMRKVNSNDGLSNAYMAYAVSNLVGVTQEMYSTCDDFRKAFSDYSNRIAYLETLETAIMQHDPDKSSALLDAVTGLKREYENRMLYCVVDSVYSALMEIDGWVALFTGNDALDLPDISAYESGDTNIREIASFLIKKSLNDITGGLLSSSIATIELLQYLDGRSPALYDFIETEALMRDSMNLLQSAEDGIRRGSDSAGDIAAYHAAFELSRQLRLLQYQAFLKFYQADGNIAGDDDKQLFLEEEITKLMMMNPDEYDRNDLRADRYVGFWDETEQRYYYRTGGAYLSNTWGWIDGNKYYFDADGHPLTGKQNMTPITGETDKDCGPAYYYFSTGANDVPANQDHYGVMQKGFINLRSKNYYTVNGLLYRNKTAMVAPQTWYSYDDDAEMKNLGFPGISPHMKTIPDPTLYDRFGVNNTSDTITGQCITIPAGNTSVKPTKSLMRLKSSEESSYRVNLYNAEGNVIGTVTDTELEVMDESSASIQKDENGRIYIYTPFGRNVHTEIITDEGTQLDYSVIEYSGENILYRVDYRDVTVGSKGTVEGVLDYSEEDKYKLVNGQEEQEADEIQNGEDYKFVNVEVQGNGKVDYDQAVLKGDFVFFNAQPEEENSFSGWFSDTGELLSDEPTYKVRVLTDIHIRAVFVTDYTTYNITLQPQSQTVTAGNKVTFKIIATGKNLTYKWEFRTNAEGEWKTCSQTSDTLSFTASRQDGGQYRVIVIGDGGSVTSEIATLKVLFKDVTDPSKYYYDPVYWAAENEITVGYTSGANAGKFGVGFDCQRRELLIFMWRYAGCPEGYDDARTMFNDLSGYGPNTDTNKAIAWAYTEGITKGYSDGGFHPKASIVRKDVMIMLYRMAGKPKVSGSLTFTDCKNLKKGTDTYNAILWGSQKGITKGYTSGQYSGMFGNNLNCLREQIVTFLYRYALR